VEGFPLTVPTPVRFRDLDAMGHVNSAVFYDYAAGVKKPVPDLFRSAAAPFLAPGV
jgi:acyl-CoA thioesterase FadM